MEIIQYLWMSQAYNTPNQSLNFAQNKLFLSVPSFCLSTYPAACVYSGSALIEHDLPEG